MGIRKHLQPGLEETGRQGARVPCAPRLGKKKGVCDLCVILTEIPTGFWSLVNGTMFPELLLNVLFV